MFTHNNCGGKFINYHIKGHGYCFMRCEKCGGYLGGEKTKQKVTRLLATKVSPRLERI